MSAEIPAAWGEAARRIAALPEPRIVYVVGGTDTGKTTFCRDLQQRLQPAAYLDCDPGQSVIGPPATVGLWVPAGREGGRTWLRFVGSTSPSGRRR